MSREIQISLPTLHEDQVKAYLKPGRYKAIRCGRRWGKTALASTIAADGAIKGESIGWFSPTYKFQAEAYADISRILSPLIQSSSKIDGVIRLTTDGRIDFWSLENDRAGRSRKYHKVIIDEAAFAGPGMTAIWEQAIEPTLLDYTGSAWALSNANGNDPDNFFWRICNVPDYGFVEYWAPTANNPYMPAAELEKLRDKKHPLVYAQEYLAEFVNFNGASFFARENLLIDGQPAPYPTICDSVFVTMDTAVKDGKEHDSTAVIFWAYDDLHQIKLRVLDYDIVKIKGALLEEWLPTVYQRLDAFGKECHARYPARDVWIEDKQSGSVLLQQAARRGWSALPIESKLTALGKSERAISVSGYVFQGLVKLCKTACDREINLGEMPQNHLLTQLANFRVGDKESSKAKDDLVDCFTYGISLALGNSEGF